MSDLSDAYLAMPASARSARVLPLARICAAMNGPHAIPARLKPWCCFYGPPA